MISIMLMHQGKRMCSSKRACTGGCYEYPEALAMHVTCCDMHSEVSGRAIPFSIGVDIPHPEVC